MDQIVESIRRISADNQQRRTEFNRMAATMQAAILVGDSEGIDRIIDGYLSDVTSEIERTTQSGHNGPKGPTIEPIGYGHGD